MQTCRRLSKLTMTIAFKYIFVIDYYKKVVVTNMKKFIISILIIALPSCNLRKETGVKPLNGEETANLIAGFYQDLGPRLGSHLVEPNTVLTIAGMRGSGKFVIHNLTKEEQNKIEKLNEKSKKLGIQFTVDNDEKDNSANISILNLKGLEYTTNLSKLPFVKPFNAGQGFEAESSWGKAIIENAQKNFPNIKKYSAHLITGLMLGYPDKAILGVLNNVNEGIISSSELVDSNIPYSSYLREHANDPVIAKTLDSWGKLLIEFHKSNWCQSIAKDPEFIKNLKSELDLYKNWFKNFRQ